MLLWALWRSSLPSATHSLFCTCVNDRAFEQAEPFGLMLLNADWQKEAKWELEVFGHLHVALPVRAVQAAMSRLGAAPCSAANSVYPGLQKVARLLDEVQSRASAGHPQEILKVCEDFARYKGQWLKVAGLEKAEILEASFGNTPPNAHEVSLEFGVFVGYTAVRLGCLSSVMRAHLGAASLEVNPVHVCVARHMLDLGSLAPTCEVHHGQAKDALPRLSEELGSCSAGFAFMDHRGTIFHQDLTLLQHAVLTARSLILVADNTLNPGAPVFLWERVQTNCPNLTVAWALTEFLAEHEDWTAVCNMRFEGTIARP